MYKILIITELYGNVCQNILEYGTVEAAEIAYNKLEYFKKCHFPGNITMQKLYASN